MFRKKTEGVNVSRHPLNSCVPGPELYGLDRNASEATLVRRLNGIRRGQVGVTDQAATITRRN